MSAAWLRAPGGWRPWRTVARRSATASVLPEALAFLDPIDQICEERPPPFLRATHALAAALFVSLLAVAALVQIDVVVTGVGRIATDTAPIVLQPMERAILREMKTKPGDRVARGQVLATLDPTFARADQASLSGQLRALRAQSRRLEAEIAATAPEPARQGDSDDALQMALYRERQAEYRSRLMVFDEDLERLRANLRTTEENRAALERQLEITRSVETMRKTLLAQQTGSRLQYLDAVASRMRAERELAEMANRLPELRHGLDSRAAERQGFVDGWRRELSESLVAARAEIAKLVEAVAKSSRLNDLVVVTAPEDGVVLDVAQRSGGSVLREAEPLVTITPSHATLIAEIMIGSRDVGYVLPGAAAEIKVDAFPYQRHGTLKGHLLSVSEESRSSPDGAESLHRGRVGLSDTRLDHVAPDGHLFPGMTLTAEIKIGTRSALSYFLTPITRGFRESLREP